MTELRHFAEMSLESLVKTLNALYDAGMSREDLEDITSKPDLACAMVAFIHADGVMAVGTYNLHLPVLVEYDLTRELLVTKAGFDYVEKIADSREVTPRGMGSVELSIRLLRTLPGMPLKEVWRWLEKRGLVAASFHELLGLAIKYPNLQHNYSILGLENTFDDGGDGSPVVPYIRLGDRGIAKKALYYISLDNEIFEGCVIACIDRTELNRKVYHKEAI